MVWKRLFVINLVFIINHFCGLKYILYLMIIKRISGRNFFSDNLVVALCILANEQPKDNMLINLLKKYLYCTTFLINLVHRFIFCSLFAHFRGFNYILCPTNIKINQRRLVHFWMEFFARQLIIYISANKRLSNLKIMRQVDVERYLLNMFMFLPTYKIYSRVVKMMQGLMFVLWRNKYERFAHFHRLN